MTSAAYVKRSRATAEQLSLMVDFLTENPGLAAGKFAKMHGKYEHEKMWIELAAKLNNAGGALKSVEQRYSVWKDLKSRPSTKVRDRRRQQARTGNRPMNQELISELEKRVVSLIGSEYIKGNESVKENVPLEEELQLRLEEDDENVVLEMQASLKEELDVEAQRTPKTPRRCLKRKRHDEDDTRDKFLEIVQRQASALEMLAESNRQNVEVRKLMAEAVKTMGEGLKHVADAFNNLSASIDWL